MVKVVQSLVLPKFGVEWSPLKRSPTLVALHTKTIDLPMEESPSQDSTLLDYKVRMYFTFFNSSANIFCEPTSTQQSSTQERDRVTHLDIRYQEPTWTVGSKVSDILELVYSSWPCCHIGRHGEGGNTLIKCGFDSHQGSLNRKMAVRAVVLRFDYFFANLRRFHERWHVGSVGDLSLPVHRFVHDRRQCLRRGLIESRFTRKDRRDRV